MKGNEGREGCTQGGKDKKSRGDKIKIGLFGLSKPSFLVPNTHQFQDIQESGILLIPTEITGEIKLQISAEYRLLKPYSGFC